MSKSCEQRLITKEHKAVHTNLILLFAVPITDGHNLSNETYCTVKEKFHFAVKVI